MSARTLFWICWINSLVWTAQSQITRLSCPSFVENTLVRLSLEVDNSSFSSCSIGPTTVTCYFTPANGTKSNICGQSVEQCNTVPTPDECVCMGSTGTGYTYSLNFTARQADHGGGDFSCDFDCIILPPSSSTPPSVDIAPSCLKIAVVPPATTPPNTTTETPPTSDQGCSICSKGTDCDEPDLICLLFLLLLIPIVILIITLWYFFVHKPKTDAAKKAKGRELESLPQDQQATNGNKPADGNGSVQRDNKVGTGHVATNGARNGERVSKSVQETELTKVRETSSPPSGEEETSPNGTVRPLPTPNVPVPAPSPRLPPLHSSTTMTSVERNSQVPDVPQNPRPLPLPGINKSTKM